MWFAEKSRPEAREHELDHNCAAQSKEATLVPPPGRCVTPRDNRPPPAQDRPPESGAAGSPEDGCLSPLKMTGQAMDSFPHHQNVTTQHLADL